MIRRSTIKIADYVSECLQLAILLEVSAYPKPGNVHRTSNFQKTRYEQFLVSAVAVAPYFRHATERGIMVATKEISPNEVEIGAAIKDATQEVCRRQRGGNTLLGSIILLSPMAVAAGMMFAKGKFSVITLRKNLKTVAELTTPMDAVEVYDAISIAKPGGLGKAPKLDVADPDSKRKILNNKVTLFEIFKIASPYDSVASEWVNNYPITFDLGYPYFAQQLKQTDDINVATVNTFLKILSEVPDTLIARKAGLAKSREVTARAKEVLEIGDLTTSEGRKKLMEFDRSLRDAAHKLNPGTTADLITAVLAISTLGGYRP